MGGGSGWCAKDWDDFKTHSVVGKSTDEVFAKKAKKEMLPVNIAVRESRDSKDNPNSTPIILALDSTGSMGIIADSLARDGLNTLVQEILERKPVSNPHIMAMAVGDAEYDTTPLLATQFEADIRIAKQLTELKLEKGGGPNEYESYNLPWYFAARKTSIESLEKRGKKGILFTFGDEECPPKLSKHHIKEIFGDDVQDDIPTKDLLAMAQEKYDVFHVVVEQGNYARAYRSQTYDSWNEVLPQGRIIPLKDYTKVAEVVISVLERHAGKSVDEIAKSWKDKSTGLIVRDAIKDMAAADQEKGAGDMTVWRPKKAGGGRGRG